jgi:hypothetical protein
MAKVRLELADEELERARNGSASVHDVSPNAFLHIGLDLEEHQYVSILSGWFAVVLIINRRLLKEYVKPKLSTDQLAAVSERRATLYRRITKWQHIQSFYMPAASTLLASDDHDTGDTPQAEDIPLCLPSGCQQPVSVPASLADIEIRLRVAQAEDSLVELRRLLRISSGLWDYKRTQLGPSQRAGTRARTLITKFNDKASRCANRYRAAHSALVGLDPGGEWSKRLRVLKAEHIKGPRRDEDDASEGRRELSWIWMIRSEGEVAEEMADIGDSKC